MHDICFVRFGTGFTTYAPLCTSSTVKVIFMLLLFFESQKELLENSYIDDLIVCIVRKKVDNKLTICKPLVGYSHRYFSCKEVRCLS